MHSETITIVILAFSLAVAGVWLIVGHLLNISSRAALHWAIANTFIGIGLSLWVINKDTQDVLFSSVMLLAAFCMMRRGIQIFMRVKPTDYEQAFVIFNGIMVFYAYNNGMITPLTSASFSIFSAWTLLRCSIEAKSCMVREFPFKVVAIPLAPVFFLGSTLLLHAGLTTFGLASKVGDVGLTSADNQILRIFLIGVLVSAFIFNVSLAFIVVSRLVLKLRHLSTRDHLTGLHNRRSIQSYISVQVELMEKKSIPFSMVMIDLDRFKAINDNFGHDAGDLVLKRISHVFLDVIGSAGCVSRLGGEEFCVILPGCSTDKAAQIAEHIRIEVEEEMFEFPKGTLTVTASMGVACCSSPVEGWSGLMKRADIAMYKAKKNGRNRVEIADALTEPAINNQDVAIRLELEGMSTK